MGGAIYSEQITKLSSGHGDLRLTIMPPYPYYPQGIFVEDIKAPIQHRYDMSATHAHIDRGSQLHTEAPINDGFPLLLSTPLFSTCVPSSQWKREGWAWTAVHLRRVFLHWLLAAQGSSIILFLSPLPTFTRPLLYSICNRNSLLFAMADALNKWNHADFVPLPARYLKMHPPPLHQMGRGWWCMWLQQWACTSRN